MLVITGIIDGPLSGGLPKAVELTAIGDIADLSRYSLDSATNGNPATPASQFTFPADSLAAGEKVYVSYETAGFTEYFGFAPTYTSSIASVNGDDAFLLYENGTVVDAFGVEGVDGTGEPWEYLDGWAYRVDGSMPSATFDPSQWTFSGPNADDGETSNATAATPFPIGTYSADATEAPLVLSEIAVSTTGADWEFVEIAGTAGTSLDGVAVVQVDGTGVVRSVTDLTGGTIGETGFYLAASPTAEATFAVVADQSIGDNTFTNVSSSYLLVSDFTGVAIGTDLDADDDGVLETTPWAGVLDGVAVIDDDTPLIYADAIVGPDGSFLGAGARRAGDGSFTLTSFGDSADYSPTAGSLPPEPDPDPEFVLISDIQGSAATWIEQFGRTDATPYFDRLVSVTAIVVGDFQASGAGTDGNLGGYFLQEEDADADGSAATSEGIFVYEGSNVLLDVQVGDKVTVLGIATEYFGETEIELTSVTVESSGNPLPTPAEVTFPVTQTVINPDGQLIADLEPYEGMLVSIQQPMTVADTFDYGRYGEIGLYADGRLETYTQTHLPDADGFADYVDLAVRNTVVLNDGLTSQNPANLPWPDGSFDAADDLTSGDTVTDILGVVHYSRSSGGSGDENYRINPIEAPTFENTNPREAYPARGGRLAQGRVLQRAELLQWRRPWRRLPDRPGGRQL